MAHQYDNCKSVLYLKYPNSTTSATTGSNRKHKLTSAAPEIVSVTLNWTVDTKPDMPYNAAIASL